MTLDMLKRRMPAIIKGFSPGNQDLETRLREIGFAEGDSVEALHFGLINRNPMSVRLNGALIALRRSDASAIIVERVNVDSSDNERSAA